MGCLLDRQVEILKPDDVPQVADQQELEKVYGDRRRAAGVADQGLFTR